MSFEFDHKLFCWLNAAEDGNINEGRRILEKGEIDINTAHYHWGTALCVTACKGQAAFAEMLLDEGADLHIRDNRGMTALSAAAEFGHDGVLKILMDAGADISVRDVDGMTPVHMAAKNGHAGALKRLLDAGARHDARNNAGETPLQLAEQEGRKEACRLLQEMSRKTAGHQAVRRRLKSTPKLGR